MSKAKWKGTTLMAPVPPVMVTCGDLDNPNVLTIAWTGILNSQPPKTYISVRPERYSYNLIKNSGEFVINLTTTHMVRIADWCGVKSGKDVNKIELQNLELEPATELSAPMLAASPVNLECKVSEIIPLGTHHMFIADIVAVNVEEKYIDDKGKLHLEQCSLATYAHGDYFAPGKKIGSFGFSVKKKRTKPTGKKRK